MASHKCSRTECPADGPKVNCIKCKNKCNLKCFGFEKSATIDGNESVKKKLSDGTVVVMFVSCMAFVCCDNDVAANEVRAGLKWPHKRDTSANKSKSSGANDNMITNEIQSIKDLLQSIKNATDINTAEIAEIKSLSTKTEANVKKVTEQSGQMNQCTPATGAAMNYAQAYRSNALSKAAGQTPTSAPKRKRFNSPISGKMELPAPKIGTKSSVSGLSVVPKLNRSKDDKPKFDKALFVSRFHPETTCEQITEYITSNTTVTDGTKFNVHKMVRKDADISALKFVSFKVELNADELDILDDGNLWPENVIVREFKPAPKNEFGNYFPKLVDKSKPATSNTTDANMETDQMR